MNKEGVPPPAAAGALGGPEDVHLGVLPVPHPVHQRDLAPEVVEIAVEGLAVEKHADQRAQNRRLLCSEVLGGSEGGEAKEAGQGGDWFHLDLPRSPAM